MREYEQLKIVLDKAILLDAKRGGENIILYPYGYMGMLAKQMLNEQYGIEEKCIVDNILSKTNPKIKALKDLGKEELEEGIFVITSDNRECFDVIRRELRKYVKKEEHIVDLCIKVRLFNERRVESLRLTAEWMQENGISGNVAEVGVWSGAFAEQINKYFPTKKLYLFDTFEGFHHEEVSKFIDQRMSAHMKSVNDYCMPKRSIGQMLEAFTAPENCIIRKGFFPNTTEGLEDTFCFVSLDVDLYQGTKDGLEWFWPRMVKHGVIFVHDYSNFDTPGVKMAVDAFCREKDLAPVFLPDYAGSVVLKKI